MGALGPDLHQFAKRSYIPVTSAASPEASGRDAKPSRAKQFMTRDNLFEAMEMLKSNWTPIYKMREGPRRRNEEAYP